MPVAMASATTGGAVAPTTTGPAGGTAADQPLPPAPLPPGPAPAPGPAGAATVSPTTGLARAPRGAPRAVRQVIAAGNQIVGLPYRYGGGHAAFKDTAYDCSGSVSYALHGGKLVTSPLDSVSFALWGKSGRGRWITVYTNPQHAYAIVAGLRLDTSGTGGSGPRWQTAQRSSTGFAARHPAGL